ncbi:DUF302 domain-containing protein [Psychromonas algicola]|uniref:DUF302 domain-containing protein n=1 Tax=Psychromonas algicola TaxID=2555642 RepID=UPI001068BE56|nr:DUF302 domain-containing protein [Psychromonas sp. RZ5]TEW52356.1 DUF302 domain-containing protein [Psychromonas sp. RZ5]
MKKIISLLALSFFASGYANATESLISVASHHSAKQTADKFVSIVEKKGLTLFARIDHQKNAAGADLKLRETEVIIFGNPKVGTPIMQCSQQSAIDFPQKILVWTDADNKTWLSYNNPEYIKERHNIKGCDKVLTKVAGVLSALTNAASK